MEGRAPGYVVAEQDVPSRTDPDDTAGTRLTIGPPQGCERLEQRVIRFGRGRSRARTLAGVLEVLYVVSGRGTIEVHGRSHALEPETGVYVAQGETYQVVNDGPDEFVLVAVSAPQQTDGVPPEQRTVRYSEQPSLPATAGREFRFLVTHEVGCRDVTQFVGVIPTGRAPLHSHTYDEVVYVVAGEGRLHIEDRETPIAAGSCIHLPPLVEHCLENTGQTAMRVLGVFHPAGDPASRASEANQ